MRPLPASKRPVFQDWRDARLAAMRHEVYTIMAIRMRCRYWPFALHAAQDYDSVVVGAAAYTRHDSRTEYMECARRSGDVSSGGWPTSSLVPRTNTLYLAIVPVGRWRIFGATARLIKDRTPKYRT